MMNQKGISFIEVLVGLLLLVTIVAPFTNIFIQSNRIRSSIEKGIDIIYLARNHMELIMAQNYKEAIAYTGTLKREDYMLKTAIFPYCVEIGGDAIFIMVENDIDNEYVIKIYTSEGESKFSLSSDNFYYIMDIDVQNSHYCIKLDGYIIQGEFKGEEKLYFEIDLVDMPISSNLELHMTGDAKARIYTGLNTNCNIIGNIEYETIPKYTSKDYAIFRVLVEVYRDSPIPLYKLENIISLKH